MGHELLQHGQSSDAGIENPDRTGVLRQGGEQGGANRKSEYENTDIHIIQLPKSPLFRLNKGNRKASLRIQASLPF